MKLGIKAQKHTELTVRPGKCRCTAACISPREQTLA